MFPLLLALIQGFTPQGPHWLGLGVPPAAWGRAPLEAVAGPASGVRLERGIVSAFATEETGGGWTTGFSAGRSWEALALTVHASGQLDREHGVTSFGATVARVITGSPFGFIEEFFGPSIAVGLGIRGSSWQEESAAGDDESRMGLDLDTGVQFSVFPTFALGFSGLRVLGLADSTGEAVYSYGASYIFNRDLAGHLAWTSGGAGFSAGADLRVSGSLRVRAGTDGECLTCGAALRVTEALEAGYGLRLDDDNTARHSLGIALQFGERRSFR